MGSDAHADRPYALGDERPPWIESASEPTYWDPAFGSYGDGYLEWVTSRYFWDPDDVRGVGDTRHLWQQRRDYALDPVIVELNTQLERQERRRRHA